MADLENTYDAQFKVVFDAIRQLNGATRAGAYSYQQIAKEFGGHFTTVGRVVRRPLKGVSATGARG